MPRIDLNADVGEALQVESEAELLALITSANIACGGHAGDVDTMASTLHYCKSKGIRIGAHPSYPDILGFGRKSVDMDAGSITDSVVQQVSSLMALAAEIPGIEVTYIKPHGALYNDAVVHTEVAHAIAAAALTLDRPVMCLPDSELRSILGDDPSKFIREGFADRRYAGDGTLLPRSIAGAVIADPEEAAGQALRLAPKVDSICIHSDTPGALQIALKVRARLMKEGWDLGA